jgi:hypothetical protein
MEKNKKQRIYYNFNYLEKFCNDNNLILINDYSKLNVKRETFIEIRCRGENCENVCNKKFINLVINKNFGCVDCTPKLKSLKTKNTCIKKYGVNSNLKCNKVRDKIKKTMIERYGHEHALKCDKLKNKYKETCVKKFGVENPTLNFDVKNKVKQTCIAKFGFENPFQSEAIKNKIKMYNINNYGFECNSKSQKLKDKYKQTCLEKYGKENHTQNENVKEKIKQSNIIKYGVENVMQNVEIMEKSSKNAYKSKQYILPSGKIIKIQGYENLALDYLINIENISENDILTGCKNVPTIWYNDNKEKSHRHYVDIYIPSQNKCIEVKSTWTAEKNKNCIYLKQESAKKLGYNYEIWIYNKKGERVETFI